MSPLVQVVNLPTVLCTLRLNSIDMKIDNIIEHNDFMTPIVDKLNDLFDKLKTDDKMKNTHESNVVVGDVWDSVNLLNVDFDGREEFFKWMLGYSHLISLSILTLSLIHI